MDIQTCETHHRASFTGCMECRAEIAEKALEKALDALEAANAATTAANERADRMEAERDWWEKKAKSDHEAYAAKYAEYIARAERAEAERDADREMIRILQIEARGHQRREDEARALAESRGRATWRGVLPVPRPTTTFRDQEG